MKKIVLFLLVCLSILSCDIKNGKKLLPGSIGRFNELLLVMNPLDWEGKIGIELKKAIKADIIGLPQPEPQFAVTQIPNQGFKGFLKHNRNILIIKKGNKPSYEVLYDTFSKPQVIVEIKGPDKQAIINLIKENTDDICSTFKDHDLSMIQTGLRKRSHKKETITFFTDQKLGLYVPGDYVKVDDKADFVWFRKRFEDYGYNVNGSLNIVAYTLPLTTPFDQLKDSIISIRNTIGKKNLPGGTEGTYLITEAAYKPHIFDSELDDKPGYKVYGKWEIYNDFVAGPFVGYYIHDKVNNRLVVVEGIVYAPGIKKRDFMFEVEAIIRSLKID
jgi:hypothetical protein